VQIMVSELLSMHSSNFYNLIRASMSSKYLCGTNLCLRLILLRKIRKRALR